MSESRWKVGGRLAPAFGRKLLAVALGATLGMGLLAPAEAAYRLNKKFTNPNAQVEVFVRLSTPSVAELNADAVNATGDLATDQAQAAQVTAINSEQASMRGVLAAHGATLLSSLKVGANGLRVRVAASEVADIRALPGVRSVGRVVRYRANNITSVPSIGAPEVWARYKARGKGVTIGIIDSGIDYTHANFGGPGTPEAYAANNKNIIEPGTFPTAKVVGGYDFAGADYNADLEDSEPVPDPDPLDGNNPDDPAHGHGSHVAGTAAGFGVPGSIGPGVAPDAKLYALKVFGDNGGSTNLVSDAIEWALDPNHDGNMRDHLDVINMSLGSDYGDPNDPSAISAENAVKLGIVVVASSGNAGAAPYVTGSPAVAPSVISTAAVTPAGRSYSRVNVTAPASVAGFKNNLEGSSPVTVASVAPLTAPLVKALNPLLADTPTAVSDDACMPLTNASAVSGKIVLAIRGSCNFTVKAANAAAAGARAIIVRNNGNPTDGTDPIVMALDGATIPGVMIGFADGQALAGVATTDASSPVTVTLDVAPDPTKDDQIATFSSRGPGHGGSTFKPDLSAPGVSIVSTGVGTGTGAANLQGTSMSSPHVAGAAALLHQLHPRLKPDAIKALLQNSTINANTSGDTALARQGVGSLRVSNAADLTSYASPGGISFGRLNPILPQLESETVTLHNMDNRTRVFRVKHRPHSTYPGVTVSCPSTVVVPRGGSEKFQVRLLFNPLASGKADAFDEARVSQTEVDGWCVLDDGRDELRVGYLAVVDAASNMTVIPGRGDRSHRIFNIGPVPGIAEGFTFARNGGARYGRNDEKPDHTFDDVGFRTAAPGQYEPYEVVELGISLKQNYESLSDLSFQMDLDTNGDGKTDVTLLAADLQLLTGDPNVEPGTYFTAQVDAATNEGFIDWQTVGWDFNDRVLVLPFTKNTGPGTGFVPTSKFSYTLTVTSNNGSVDTQTGTIDFSKELTPDLNDFVLDPLGSAEVSVTGKAPGKLMWLMPNDQLKGQSVSLQIAPPETHQQPPHGPRHDPPHHKPGNRH
jgi:subtilisin family serine protease